MPTQLDKLSPGDETWISDPTTDPDELQPDSRWHANLHRYQLYSALLVGGDEVLKPPPGTLHPISGQSLDDASYLTRLPAESSEIPHGAHKGDDAFDRRLCAGVHDPVAARIVSVYVDTFSRQAVDRSAVAKVLGDETMKDVDGQGTDAEDWLAAAYYQGLGHGWMLGCADLPEGDPTELYPSMAHQEASGDRPYLSIILPIRVWQMRLDDRGRVVYALIHEAEHRWREWFPEYSVVWEGKVERVTRAGVEWEDERPQPQAPVQHSFGRVPLELFTANDPNPNDPDAPWGVSAMKATALVDLRILNALSLLDDDIRKTGFPLFHVQMDPETGLSGDITLGSGFAFYSEADAEWKAPPPELSEALWSHIDKLESMAMKMGGVHRRSQDSVEAHSGLALDWENAPIYATVQRWARRLREWETRLWRLMAMAQGKDGGDLEVIYPDDFSSRPAEADIRTAQELVVPYGGKLNACPDFVQVSVQALQRRAIQRLIGADPDVRQALEEADLKPMEKPVLPPALGGPPGDEEGGEGPEPAAEEKDDAEASE